MSFLWQAWRRLICEVFSAEVFLAFVALPQLSRIVVCLPVRSIVVGDGFYDVVLVRTVAKSNICAHGYTPMFCMFFIACG